MSANAISGRPIVFFGLWRSFDYGQIGGVDSMIRRLANELVDRSYDVTFCHYEAPATQCSETANGIVLRYFQAFEDAASFVVSRPAHVVTVYLRPRDRMRFVRLRRSHAEQCRFHQIYFSYAESSIKRRLMVADERIYPHNGSVFAISPRLRRLVPGNRGLLLLPPVPHSYYVPLAEKSHSRALRVTYLGRIDPAKGTEEVLNLFNHLAAQDGAFETQIHGYPWLDKRESAELHARLLAQDRVAYFPQALASHSAEVEAQVAGILRDTDVLYLPYRQLSSTTDTPLLLMESMAALCVPLTRPLGDMPQLVGSHDTMVSDPTDLSAAHQQLTQIKSRLAQERARLAQRVQHLQFSTAQVTDSFLQALDA